MALRTRSLARGASVNDTRQSRGRPERFRSYGLVGWWRADVGTGASWTDKSGQGNHLLQGTGGSQPTLTASAISGKPAFVFDGVDDFQTAAFTLNQPATELFVVKNVVIGVAATHDVLTDGGIVGRALLLQDTSPAFTMTAGASLTSATRQADGVFNYWTATFNGASSTFRAQGAQLLSGNASTNNPAGLTLGALQNGARPANVAFAEAMAFNVALAISIVQRLEGYLAARHGI